MRRALSALLAITMTGCGGGCSPAVGIPLPKGKTIREEIESSADYIADKTAKGLLALEATVAEMKAEMMDLSGKLENFIPTTQKAIGDHEDRLQKIEELNVENRLKMLEQRTSREFVLGGDL